MSAASNSAGALARTRVAGTDPSMEEILASIRRIIAYDQAMMAEAAAGSVVQVAASAAKPVPAADETNRSGDAAPVPDQPVTPAPVVQAARSPAAKTDDDFEAWLSETARRARANQFESAPEDVETNAPADTNPRKVDADSRPAWAEGWDELEDDQANAAGSVRRPFNPDDADWSEEDTLSEADPEIIHVQADHEVNAQDMTGTAGNTDKGEAAGRNEPAEIVSSVESAQVANMSAAEPTSPAASSALDDDDELDAPVSPSPEQSGLMSSNTSTSVSASFQALAQTMMLQNSDMIESSIRGMLKPMLKQWLDDNLPPLVERLVRAEIERVARGGP
jgi:cell pole-organizing protein PopZ